MHMRPERDSEQQEQVLRQLRQGGGRMKVPEDGAICWGCDYLWSWCYYHGAACEEVGA